MVKIRMKKKTAVVVIHGIGEQRPMDTLWGFVKATWITDSTLVHPSRNEVYSKPETATGSFELRRVTTREASAGDKKRADFFEFYWAHHMQGHTLGGLSRWVLGLFLRKPSSVPGNLLGLWLFGVALLMAAAALALFWLTDKAGYPIIDLRGQGALVGLASPALALLGFLINAKVLPHAGDAARYLSAEPDNVAIRQKIREEGVALLEKLSGNGEYDRIVMVGHSLGSVIAYDILNFAWNRLDDAAIKALHIAGSPAIDALDQLETAGRTLRNWGSEDGSGDARTAYRDAQRVYAGILAAGDHPVWLVSDLITLGSPLSKAEILLARDAGDFGDRRERREFPACPPIYETATDGKLEQFSYPVGADSRRPHHAALFGPVVWTNVYVPNRLIFFGDIVSGPVRDLFGAGVADVHLPIGSPPGFRHLDYWKLPVEGAASPAINALRRALNLRGQNRDGDIWQDQAGQVPIRGGDL